MRKVSARSRAYDDVTRTCAGSTGHIREEDGASLGAAQPVSGDAVLRGGHPERHAVHEHEDGDGLHDDGREVHQQQRGLGLLREAEWISHTCQHAQEGRDSEYGALTTCAMVKRSRSDACAMSCSPARFAHSTADRSNSALSATTCSP